MSGDKEAQRRGKIESETAPLKPPRSEEQSAGVHVTSADDDLQSPRAMTSEVSPLDTSETANAQPGSRISNEEWRKWRDTLRKLYIEEELILKDVIRIMAAKYNFVVTYGNAPTMLWKHLSHAPNLI